MQNASVENISIIIIIIQLKLLYPVLVHSPFPVVCTALLGAKVASVGESSLLNPLLCWWFLPPHSCSHFGSFLYVCSFGSHLGLPGCITPNFTVGSTFYLC